ncbi:MAG: hypothetical protein KGI72_05480, partial [Patescibacteria group bacterium]|nr:hypothetical protein [Patescibacteria group bacterium]
YKKEKGNYNDFLRIEELNYNGFIYYEWVDGPSPFFRGGYWSYGSNVGAEALSLGFDPSHTYSYIGFRCAR